MSSGLEIGAIRGGSCRNKARTNKKSHLKNKREEDLLTSQLPPFGEASAIIRYYLEGDLPCGGERAQTERELGNCFTTNGHFGSGPHHDRISGTRSDEGWIIGRRNTMDC